MDGVCPVPATGSAFLAGMLQHIDCQAQTIGAVGYQALSNPGSAASIVLTAFLTLFIAIFGIRMLMGYSLGVGDLIGAVFKLGIVLAVASSWSAYRVVVYDTVLRGPAELLSGFGEPSGLPGSAGGLVARLQSADDAMLALTNAGTGRFDLAAPATGTATPQNVRPPLADDLAFGLARIAYLGGSLGALGLVRIVAGLMLALAPAFAALLLFEGTRSFFMGWVKTLVAAALGALLVTAALAIELAILEPWLAQTLAFRGARYATPAAPIELLVITGSFALILAGLVGAAARVSFTAAWPASFAERLRDAWLTSGVVERGRPQPVLAGPDPEVSRAYVVADALATAQQREGAARDPISRRIFVPTVNSQSGTGTGNIDAAPLPLGQTHRRVNRRSSLSAQARSNRK